MQITELTDDHDLSPACEALVDEWLDPGEIVSCTYTVNHSQIGEHENEASVTVENEDGGTATDTDDETVEVIDLLPEVLLEKSVVPGSRPEPGGTFTFTLKITNISDETFVIDDLTDDYPLSAQCLGLIGLSLGPDASTSCQYTVNRTNAGMYDNTAEVFVSDNEDNEDSDADDASFEITDVAPTILVEKTAAPLSMNEPGGQFTFTVKVTNTSDEVVTITSLTDDKFGNLNNKGTCDLGEELDPDETYTCTFPGTFTGNAGASHTNTVTAIAEDDEGSEATNSDDATVTLVNVRPDISVDKTVSQLTRPEPGGSFTFTVVVTNHSFEAVTLTSLVDNVHGNLNGQGTCATGGSIAANGGTYSCFFAADFFGNAGDSETDTVTAIAVDNDGTTRHGYRRRDRQPDGRPADRRRGQDGRSHDPRRAGWRGDVRRHRDQHLVRDRDAGLARGRHPRRSQRPRLVRHGWRDRPWRDLRVLLHRECLRQRRRLRDRHRHRRRLR